VTHQPAILWKPLKFLVLYRLLLCCSTGLSDSVRANPVSLGETYCPPLECKHSPFGLIQDRQIPDTLVHAQSSYAKKGWGYPEGHPLKLRSSD
jgi:hypothetical protein